MSKALFEEDSDSGGELQLGTNKEYAKSYNTFRQKELLKKRELTQLILIVIIIHFSYVFSLFEYSQ